MAMHVVCLTSLVLSMAPKVVESFATTTKPKQIELRKQNQTYKLQMLISVRNAKLGLIRKQQAAYQFNYRK